MLGKVALLIFVLSVIFQQISYFQSPTDCTFSHTCTNLDIKATKSRGLLFNGNRDIFNSPSIRTGSNSYKNRFQPDGCILSKYSSKSIRQCLTTFNTPHVYIGGNGVLHTLTNLTTHRMSSTDVVNSKLPIHLEISNIIQKYDTSSITATSAIKYDMITIGKQTNVVVWFNSESSSTLSSTSFSTLISDILEKENNEFSRLISISTRPMGLISPKINQDNENVLRTHTSEIHRYERLKFNVLTYRLMVLNKVCNNMMEPPPYDATCFLTFQTPSVVQGIVLFLCVVLLCSQLYHKYLYTIYLRTNGPSSIEFMNTLQDHSVQCIVCLVLLVYLCTNTGLFGIAIKGWNIYIWFVVSFFVCVITVYGIEKVKDSSLLNRQQTAEWRGWMQISFLIYHYLGAGQVPLPLYIWIRMMVASFMFMTGFGHTTYFLIKKNYNFSRIWNVLSRLNFLQILLCLVLGRPWIFYYFTPLATVWFGCIYTTLYLYSSKNNSVPFVLFKIFLLIICIEIIFSDMNGATKQNFIYQYIFMNRFTGSLFELSQDHGHFFQSRMAMDRYSVPAGMIFAVLLQKYRLLNKKSTSPSNTSDEAEGGTSIQTVVSAFKEENKYWNVLFVKIKLYSIYIGPCVLFMYSIYSYYAIELYPNNTKYNVIQIHTLFSPLIIFSFIIIRNHPRFLIFQYTSTSLIWVGGCSLELFILQYHLLLSVPNYSSLGPAGTLQLIPHSPILSAVFSTVLLFCFSHMASTSTTTILKKIRIQDVIEKMWSYLGGGSSGGSGGGGGGGGSGSGDVQIDVKNKIQTVPLS